MAKMVTVPVDLSVKRYYRIYVTVTESTTDAEIHKKITEEMDLNEELDDSMLDPNMGGIEYEDITSIYPDHEAEWTEEDDDELV